MKVSCNTGTLVQQYIYTRRGDIIYVLGATIVLSLTPQKSIEAPSRHCSRHRSLPSQYRRVCAFARQNRRNGQVRRHERRSRAGTEYGQGGSQPDAALMGILGGMLAFDPAERLSAEECLLREDVFGGGGGDDVVNITSGAADSTATGMSRGSSSGVAKGYESDEAVGTVFDQVAGDRSGGGSASNGIGIGDDFKAAVGGQDCDRTAETVSDLYDDDSVVEVGREVANGDKDEDEDDDSYDDGGFDGDEYETADDDGKKIETRAASLDDDAATGREGSRRSEVDKIPPRHKEPEQQTPPPQEKAFLGETGYVRKRVVEIEKKEEYYNSIGSTKNAPAGAGAEATSKQAVTNDEGPVATAAASEGVASDIGNRESVGCSSNLHKESDDSNAAAGSGNVEGPSASTVSSPVGVAKAIPSYRAFDSTVAVAAATTAAIAADVAEDVLNAALADVSSAEQRETNTDCPLTHGGLREGGGSKLDNSEDYTSNNEDQIEENGPEADGKTEGDITHGVIFGDEGYESDSFDEGEVEDNEGAPTDIGGRTSFFPGLGSTATVTDTAFSARASESEIVASDNSATLPGAAGLATSQSTAPTTVGTDESCEKPLNSGGEGIEDNIDNQQDNGVKTVIDEGAEKDEGEDGDGWRVAGAFRVLAASGPGGEMAVKAVKALLRQQGRQPARLLAGEVKRWGGRILIARVVQLYSAVVWGGW